MQTKYVRFDYPEDHRSLQCMNDDEINHCFHIGQYPNEAMALYVYAETPCSWNTLLDDSEDFDLFIEDAKKALLDNNINWLEEHFT